MRIGINTRFLLNAKMEGFGWFTFEIAKRLVENHPEHEFVFFFDRAFDNRFVFGKNVEPVVLFPPARHPILFKWFFDYSIKNALKKHKIDVFFSPDGFLSLTSDVPQIGVIHDLNFEHYPEDLPASPRKYLRTYFPKFAKKAKFLLTVSHFSKSDIVSTYGINPEKIEVIWNGVNEKYIPISNEEKLAVKQKWTNGKDYFIFVVALHKRKNLVTLLKAFEQFQTINKDIDLVIVGTQLWKNDDHSLPQISDELKQRIHFTGHLSLDDLTQLMAGAYALTFVSYFEGFGIPLAEAMACGVPVIAGNRTSLPEVVGDAGILVDPFSVEEITTALFRISEDKQLYKELSQKGLERSKLFSWDIAAEKVMEVILRSEKCV